MKKAFTMNAVSGNDMRSYLEVELDIRSANEEIKNNLNQNKESDDGDVFINWKQIVDNIENGNNT